MYFKAYLQTQGLLAGHHGNHGLVSSRTSDSCGGPGAVRARCGWLPGWMRTVLRNSAARLGGVSEDT